ncbi:MAG: DUF4434 domain-containing protein [Bacteroidetes bacterium]|jgi:hypothetical protein|nr:DUF4434 domain-containing protein [Bacteroidota bacterium]
MRLTGTFLDEITHDIPSQNWGAREWARDFDAMKAVGIDTVILIRAGYRDRAVFDSGVLSDARNMMPAYGDLLDLFLREAERCGMDFWFGTYDAGTFWDDGDYRHEVDINKPFCAEVAERYGDREAFAGWYISHEINAYDDGMLRVYEELSDHLRGLVDVPILMSPYMKGVKQFGGEALGFEAHVREWETAFRRLGGLVDVVAFQDGNVPLTELPRYLEANRELAAAHGIDSWGNVETFDRDVRIKFPPIDFRKLRYKMEQAADAGIDKLITFEFSHFLSPNADHPAARALHRRYREWIDVDGAPDPPATDSQTGDASSARQT